MRKIVEFLRQVRQVFNQLTWPKRETIIQLTVVVISISAFVSALLGGADYLFTRSIGLLTGRSQGPAVNPFQILPTGAEASPSGDNQYFPGVTLSLTPPAATPTFRPPDNPLQPKPTQFNQ